MINDETTRCYCCMELKPARFRICPHCGYAEDAPYDPEYAPPGTELNERYTLGIKLGHNSEGANYIGYNSAIKCKVLIREYMPVGLCKRVKGRATITILKNNTVKYKALMAEFTELNRNLAQMRSLPHIIPTLDIITANNTTYVIYEYIEGIKLTEYLKDYAGYLSWEEVAKLFPTFFTTLSLMHNQHVIHRAISPETIYITPEKELELCGFSIYDVRTMHLELPSELFDGYAAPEQYTPGAKQGTFTDVYGICAVLYRLLTGTRPVDAPSRIQLDNLSPPCKLEPKIPQNVSDAIMSGMDLDSQKRTQSITELVTQLFEHTENAKNSKEETKIVSPVPQKKNANSSKPKKEKSKNKAKTKPKDPPKEKTKEKEKQMDYTIPGQESVTEKFRSSLLIAVMTVCILLVLTIIIISVTGSSGTVSMNHSSETDIAESTENHIITESSPESVTETEAQGDSQMPALVGMSYELKKEQLEIDGWLHLEPIYAFSDTIDAGIIMEQEIEAGQPFHSGAVVKVVVSKGPSSIPLPDYAGKSLMQYEEELAAIGLTSEYYITEAVVNYGFETGYVVELNKAAGDMFDLSGDEKLKIFYASNPETTPATEPPTVTPVQTEPQEIPDMTDDSGIPLESAPFVAPTNAPEETDFPEHTEEAPATAPNSFGVPEPYETDEL